VPARVVFFYQHFWPDSPPYANLLRAIGAGLSSPGGVGSQRLVVEMLTAQPSYKATDRSRRLPAHELVDRISVTRLALLPGSSRFTPLRLLGKLLFPLRALLVLIIRRLRGERPDVIVAATIPPVLNGLCALTAARIVGARFVYHLQDVYPEIGAAAGLWPERSLRHRVLRKLDTLVAQRADRCVVLSDDMRDSLIARGVPAQKVSIINNFMLEPFDSPEGRVVDRLDAGKVADLSEGADGSEASNARRQLVFAGNLGRFQALETVLTAFLDHAATSDAFDLHFLGDGVVKDALLARAGDSSRVHFHGHVDFVEASRFIARCDAGIVSIGEGVHRYAYPSKTLTYLGLGVPVFVLVETESSLARDVREHDLGVTCGERSIEALVDAFGALERWLDSDADAQASVRRYVEAHTASGTVIERWRDLLVDLSSPLEGSTLASPPADSTRTDTSSIEGLGRRE